jgi:6-phosphogluconolactonase (cycloisomerase 2 family)
MAFNPSGRALYGWGSLEGFGNGGGLWAYRVDPSTGVLDNLRRVGKMDFPPVSLTIEPAGRFLYLGSSHPARIDAFAIDPSTGDLSAVSASPFSQETVVTASNPVPSTLTQLVADPTGRFLYASRGPTTDVTEDDSDIWAYAIDSGKGTLSPVPGSPFLRGQGVRNAGPASLAFDPGGKRLYVAVCDKVHILDVDDRGRLTPIAGSPLLLPFCSHELGVAP